MRDAPPDDRMPGAMRRRRVGATRTKGGERRGPTTIGPQPRRRTRSSVGPPAGSRRARPSRRPRAPRAAAAATSSIGVIHARRRSSSPTRPGCAPARRPASQISAWTWTCHWSRSADLAAGERRQEVARATPTAPAASAYRPCAGSPSSHAAARTIVAAVAHDPGRRLQALHALVQVLVQRVAAVGRHHHVVRRRRRRPSRSRARARIAAACSRGEVAREHRRDPLVARRAPRRARTSRRPAPRSRGSGRGPGCRAMIPHVARGVADPRRRSAARRWSRAPRGPAPPSSARPRSRRRSAAPRSPASRGRRRRGTPGPPAPGRPSPARCPARDAAPVVGVVLDQLHGGQDVRRRTSRPAPPACTAGGSRWRRTRRTRRPGSSSSRTGSTSRAGNGRVTSQTLTATTAPRRTERGQRQARRQAPGRPSAAPRRPRPRPTR